MKFNKLIDKTNLGKALGSTPAGSAWCLKALNPAHPSTTDGIPDSTVCPIVVKQFERTITIPFAAAAANWNAEIVLHANPLVPLAYSTDDGITATITTVPNTQLGNNNAAVLAFLHANCESFRVCYGSVTVGLDATALTNSGSLAASQYTYVGKFVTQDSNVGSQTRIPCLAFPDALRPYDSLAQTPGAYTGPAIDGAYLPLRIDRPRWVRTNDFYAHFTLVQAIAMGYDLTTVVTGPLQAGPAVAGWPYGLISMIIGSNGDLIYPDTQDVIGHVSLRNLNPAAVLRVTYRLGVEMSVVPNTNYSPDMKIPPIYDDVALTTYKTLSGQLKLAYPEEYNDWQKIMDAIVQGAKIVAPLLPMGSLISPFIDPTAGAVKAIVSAVQRRKANKVKKGVPGIAKSKRS